MPLTAKGEEILRAMVRQYGSREKAESVFYAMKNAGKLTGVDTADAYHRPTLDEMQRINEILHPRNTRRAARP